MSTATRPKATGSQQLQKPVNCKHCKAPHFEYTLTCRRCGKYFGETAENPHQAQIQLIIILAIAAAGAFVICRALGLA